MLVVSVPTRALHEAVGTRAGVEVVEWDLRGEAPQQKIDIVVNPYMQSPALLQAINGVDVRLVQHQSIGYDGVFDHLPAGITFANASGVHEDSTAELALTLILAMQRGIPDFVRQASRSEWSSRVYPSLIDRRVLIVGYGAVAKAIESRLIPFGTHISRVARTAREVELADGSRAEVYGIADLAAQLALAEIVVLALPLTPDTVGLIDARALAAMADGALLVNVARGSIVDTDALVDEVSSGRLRAAIDVVEPEPLPSRSPLWQLPNVLISPHVGGDSGAMKPRIVRLLNTQIDRMLAGDDPVNVINRG